MALDVKEKGKVGCAYYLSKEERLRCMEDIPRGGIETIDRRESLPVLHDCADQR